jgi:hypothetical protein
MGKFVEFTRKELFDLVWSKPLGDVANEVGVSDVAIGKGCKRANVPRPPQGYWGVSTTADRSMAVADAIRRPILAEDWRFLGFEDAKETETVDSW